MKKIALMAVVVGLVGCASVRQADLDAWKGMPVEALDTHSVFIGMPMYRTTTPGGIEVRNYANGKDVASCFGSANVASSTAFTSCSSNKIVCNNIFYIRDGKVLEYAPTGRCRTDDSVRPERRYLELSKKT